MLLNGFAVFVKGYWNTSTFITSYVGILIFALLYLGHRFSLGRRDKWLLRPLEIDLQSGLQEVLCAETAPAKREKWYQKWRALYE